MYGASGGSSPRCCSRARHSMRRRRSTSRASSSRRARSSTAGSDQPFRGSAARMGGRMAVRGQEFRPVAGKVAAMRATVCELPHEPAALARAWRALCDHTARQRSTLVLLPEFAFVEPFWESPVFDETRWARVTATSDAWIERLNELCVEYVVGTRPATENGIQFNEGFLWSRSRRAMSLRRKYFMPDET